MKLKNEGKAIRVLYPFNQRVEHGETIEIDNKRVAKDLKRNGFKEVKSKKKEGEK